MLTFTQAQLDTFQSSWQFEQLQVQLPEVMAQLAEKHPTFYSSIKPAQHLYYGRQLIRQAVTHGYTHINFIHQLLDLEYSVRKRLYTKTVIQPLYQAVWLIPQDRINAIRYLLSINNFQFNNGKSIYESFDVYPRRNRSMDIRQADVAQNDEDPRTRFVHMLRQAFYYALLKAKLYQSQYSRPGWKAWKSGWEQSLIGIEHQGYQRRILLQPSSSQVLQVLVDDDEEYRQLTLHIPDQLSDPQFAKMNEILHAWALDLIPVAAMKKLYVPEESEAKEA